MGKNELIPPTKAPPQPADYSPGAIQKYVTEASYSHPVTIFPTALGIGCALFGLLTHVTFFYYLAPVALIGPAWFAVQKYIRGETLGKCRLEALDKQRDSYRCWLIDQVKVGLSKPYATSDANAHAEQGREQFERAHIVRDAISELLTMKLNVNELTFHHFLASAEQAYLSILDNLKDVVAALKSANSIDPTELKKRISQYVKIKQLSATDIEEKETLEERLQLWNNQMERVDGILAKNEKVITAMENISSRVAEWHTDQHFAASNVESTIAELQELARYAHTMSNQS